MGVAGGRVCVGLGRGMRVYPHLGVCRGSGLGCALDVVVPAAGIVVVEGRGQVWVGRHRANASEGEG